MWLSTQTANGSRRYLIYCTPDINQAVSLLSRLIPAITNYSSVQFNVNKGGFSDNLISPKHMDQCVKYPG